MNNRHITNILDHVSFGDISTEQLAGINRHIADCSVCRSAFQSAQIASLLLKETLLSDESFSSPFFQAKVLNAWREKQII